MKNKKISAIVIFIIVVAVIVGGVLIYRDIKRDDEDRIMRDYSGPIYKSPSNGAMYDQFVDRTIGLESTLANPNILINPNQKVSNGVAYVGFNTVEPTTVSYTVKGKAYTVDPSKTADFTYEAGDDYRTLNVVPIVGLYFDYDNQVEITATTKDGKTETNTITLNVGPAHKEAHRISTVNMDIETFDKDVITELPNGFIMNDMGYLFDFNGDARSRFTTFSSAITDRGYLTGISVPDENINEVLKPIEIEVYDVLGRKYLDFDMAYDDKFHEYLEIHHDYEIDPNGNIYVLASYNTRRYYVPTSPIEERQKIVDMFINQNRYIESIVLKYDKNGELLNTWEYAYNFEGVKYPAFNFTKADLVHFNSVEYVPESNSILLSARNLNGFIMANADTGEIEWIFGDVNQYGEKDDYLLSYDAETTMIPSGQHTATVIRSKQFEEYTKDGKLIISVHNNNSSTDENDKNVYVDATETHVLEELDREIEGLDQDYSSQMIFAVDVKNKSIEFISEFAFEDAHSAITGSTFQLTEDLFGSFVGYGNQTFIIHDGKEKVLYRVSQMDAENINSNPYRRMYITQEQMYQFINNARYDEDLMNK